MNIHICIEFEKKNAYQMLYLQFKNDRLDISIGNNKLLNESSYTDLMHYCQDRIY